jgi:superfamily I DNA and RNA helicase
LKANDLVIEHSNYVEIRFTETHGPAPMIERFESRQEEFEWMSSEIRTLLLDHGVRPEQIAVVFMRNEKFEILRDLIRAKVKEDNLRGFVDSFSDQFKRSHQFNAGHITIGTVGRLKGYEAPVVFVIAADRFGVDPRGRASFYVAVTRAKQLLYISGKRTLEPSLLDEAHRAYQAMRLFNLNRSQLELSEGCEAGSQPDSAPLASVF